MFAIISACVKALVQVLNSSNDPLNWFGLFLFPLLPALYLLPILNNSIVPPECPPVPAPAKEVSQVAPPGLEYVVPPSLTPSIYNVTSVE